MKINSYLSKKEIKRIFKEVKYRKQHYDRTIGKKDNPYNDLYFNLKLIKENKSLWNLSLEHLLTKNQYNVLIDALEDNVWLKYSRLCYSSDVFKDDKDREKLEKIITKIKGNANYTEEEPKYSIYINGVLASKITDYYSYIEDGIEKIIFCGSNHTGFIKGLKSINYDCRFHDLSINFEVYDLD